MNTTNQSFEFKALPYAYNALEPFIDAMTMEIHYSRHHKTYFDNFVKAVDGTDLATKNIKEIFAEISKQTPAVRNNGGGYFNHELYWDVMIPNGGAMSESFKKIIEDQFGSVEKLKEEFSNTGITRFGSGWAWLSVDSDGKLFVSSTPNQDNPLMDITEKKGSPILAMDVWEHAYYLKYQNKRVDYIGSFWQVINWKQVEENYLNAKK